MDGPGIRRSNPTANEDVKKELIDLYKDLATLNEVDWSKIRDMAFTENRVAKRSAIETIAGSKSLDCPNFLEHVFPSQY
jgi:hypothetical protein